VTTSSPVPTPDPASLVVAVKTPATLQPADNVIALKPRERRLIALADQVGGPAAGIRTHLRPGRIEVSTVGFDPNLQLMGSDPWGSPTYTGLIVPTAPTLSAQTRYLFQLARVAFNTPESAWLTGIRLYTSLFGYDQGGNGPFELPITSPMWRFAIGGGNISFHLMVRSKNWRDKRNPANAPSVMYLDAGAPALLYLVPPPTPFVASVYAPPNAGRPYGRPIAHDLGNLHDAGRFPWVDDYAEMALNIPIPAPCDVVLYASVWQHATETSADPPVANVPNFSCSQFSASTPEDRFWATYADVQYGRIAGALTISEEMGKEYAEQDDEAPWRNVEFVPR
jgi:hypothetical protein